MKWQALSAHMAKVAVAEGEGNILALAKGTAKITVKTDNGKKATIKIKVVG